jgi:hypothetical protein
MLARVRIISKDGKPKNTDILDAESGELIHTIQRFTIDSHVDQPFALTTLEILTPEIDVLAYVEKVKIGHTWYYPAYSFNGAEEEEMETVKKDGLEYGYKLLNENDLEYQILQSLPD